MKNWVCGWGVDCVPLHNENFENVEIVGACCWGVGCVTIVKILKMAKWFGLVAGVRRTGNPMQRNTENSLQLCLEYGLCTTS